MASQSLYHLTNFGRDSISEGVRLGFSSYIKATAPDTTGAAVLVPACIHTAYLLDCREQSIRFIEFTRTKIVTTRGTNRDFRSIIGIRGSVHIANRSNRDNPSISSLKYAGR